MSDLATPEETPVAVIESDDEFRRALRRVRELEEAHVDTPEALERAALQRAIAAFMQRRRDPHTGEL